MSPDVIEPSFMLPIKRARETIDLSGGSVSKCGELFVTNCADKWIFYCTYCQKATTDIGVFICHIRLEHLNEQQSSKTATLKSNDLASSPNSTSIDCFLPSGELATNTEQQPLGSHIVKEEPTYVSQYSADNVASCTIISKILDMSSLTTQPASNETENVIANENTNVPANPADKLVVPNELLSSTDPEILENESHLLEEAIIKNEFILNSDSNLINDDSKCSNNPCSSSVIVKVDLDDVDDDGEQTNEENLDLEFIDNIAAIPTHIDTDTTSHKCQYCERNFLSKRGLSSHIRQSHISIGISSKVDGKYKCPQCSKCFRCSATLWHHKKTHQFQCPICPANTDFESTFILHVMLHENESCFPCQVCGKIFSSNEERMAHWKSHIKDRPYGCKLCYRRFTKNNSLQCHMKTHN